MFHAKFNALLNFTLDRSHPLQEPRTTSFWGNSLIKVYSPKVKRFIKIQNVIHFVLQKPTPCGSQKPTPCRNQQLDMSIFAKPWLITISIFRNSNASLNLQFLQPLHKPKGNWLSKFFLLQSPMNYSSQQAVGLTQKNCFLEFKALSIKCFIEILSFTKVYPFTEASPVQKPISF